jgi:hypothetical protein
MTSSDGRGAMMGELDWEAEIYLIEEELAA